jgi:hypothetical protein
MNRNDQDDLMNEHMFSQDKDIHPCLSVAIFDTQKGHTAFGAGQLYQVFRIHHLIQGNLLAAPIANHP